MEKDIWDADIEKFTVWFSADVANREISLELFQGVFLKQKEDVIEDVMCPELLLNLFANSHWRYHLPVLRDLYFRFIRELKELGGFVGLSEEKNDDPLKCNYYLSRIAKFIREFYTSENPFSLKALLNSLREEIQYTRHFQGDNDPDQTIVNAILAHMYPEIFARVRTKPTTYENLKLQIKSYVSYELPTEALDILRETPVMAFVYYWCTLNTEDLSYLRKQTQGVLDILIGKRLAGNKVMFGVASFANALNLKKYLKLDRIPGNLPIKLEKSDLLREEEDTTEENDDAASTTRKRKATSPTTTEEAVKRKMKKERFGEYIILSGPQDKPIGEIKKELSEYTNGLKQAQKKVVENRGKQILKTERKIEKEEISIKELEIKIAEHEAILQKTKQQLEDRRRYQEKENKLLEKLTIRTQNPDKIVEVDGKRVYACAICEVPEGINITDSEREAGKDNGVFFSCSSGHLFCQRCMKNTRKGQDDHRHSEGYWPIDTVPCPYCRETFTKKQEQEAIEARFLEIKEFEEYKKKYFNNETLAEFVQPEIIEKCQRCFRFEVFI